MLAREDSPLPATVAALVAEVAGELRDADTGAVMAEALRRAQLPGAPREAAAFAAEMVAAGGGRAEAEAAELGGAGGRPSARSPPSLLLARFAQVDAGLGGGGGGRQRHREDPLAAMAQAQAEELAAKAALLEKDVAARDAAVAVVESKHRLLVESARRLKDVGEGLRKDVASATARLLAAAPFNSSDAAGAAGAASGGNASAGSPAAAADNVLAELIARRDAQRATLGVLAPQLDEATDRVSLMRSALRSADGEFERLQADVARLRGVRDTLRREQAALDRGLASLKTATEARRRDAAYGADNLAALQDSDARAKRRLEEQVAEATRDRDALNEVRGLAWPGSLGTSCAAALSSALHCPPPPPLASHPPPPSLPPTCPAARSTTSSW